MKHLCVVGVGLIGGSLALALKRRDTSLHIIGCSRDPENLRAARRRGAIDDYHTDPAVAVRGCDIVLLAAPLGATRTVLQTIKPALDQDTVITDAGSAKAPVLRFAREVFGRLPSRFIPGHPIAGIENSGIAAASADLYQGRRVILTPRENVDPAALQAVTDMWQAAGAEVHLMDAEAHDQILAATSHLPHMLAFALTRELANSPHHDDIFRYAAGGLRDFSRIAESDPVMWRDICLANGAAILAAMDRYEDELKRLRQAIAAADTDTLMNMFGEARNARTHFRRLLDRREREQTAGGPRHKQAQGQNGQ